MDESRYEESRMDYQNQVHQKHTWLHRRSGQREIGIKEGNLRNEKTRERKKNVNEEW